MFGRSWQAANAADGHCWMMARVSASHLSDGSIARCTQFWQDVLGAGDLADNVPVECEKRRIHLCRPTLEADGRVWRPLLFAQFADQEIMVASRADATGSVGIRFGQIGIGSVAITTAQKAAGAQIVWVLAVLGPVGCFVLHRGISLA